MNIYQKKMAKLMKELCGKRNMYEVFFDFTKMSACSISNVFDKVHFEEREKLYLSIQEKYTVEEQEKFHELFALLVEALEETATDILGELYMALEIANKDAGQFFTPYNVARLMAEMNFNEKDEQLKNGKPVVFYEPCIGGGVTLIALANVMREKGYNYQRNLRALCGDIDGNVLSMAYVQCSLLGIDAIFERKNALSNEPMTDVWFTPFYALNRAKEKEAQNTLEILKEAMGLLKNKTSSSFTEPEQLTLF
ncbi:N-6 DNA methylase [Enterococcus faecalis]|uniref:N-6 DNA methylase n=1 Tax=Enterococcus faecalis TaxID=1351 RepID=UPI001E603F66|nr:N-6 DNA methylase [Enterococcus faecalis]MCD4994146.1 N-6 DNA methylase [Enterococcus faecalis]